MRAPGMLDLEGFAQLGAELEAALSAAGAIEAEIWAEADEEDADK